MSTPQRSDVRTITVGPEQRELLRVQTLTVLSFNHDGFEDVFALEAPELHALATLFRDAFVVLDVVGWSPIAADAAPVDVPLTAPLIAELRRNIDDLTHTIADLRKARDRPASDQELREFDEWIGIDRGFVDGLTAVLTAYEQASPRASPG